MVGSTLWWRPINLDRQAAVPWQKLRPSWLLALQLLAAALVVGALLQPAFATAQALSGQTIVIIDTSETMQATDVAPSRFGKAVAEARSLVAELGQHARMTLITMGPTAAVIASSDGQRQPLLDALDHLEPSAGAADLQDALQLAVAAAGPKTTGTELFVLSDGITEPLPEPVTLPFPVQYKEIGASGENVGVTALNVLPGLDGLSADARLQNYGQIAANVTVEMAANGRLLGARALELPGGGGQDVTFDVPPGTLYVQVTLLPHDDLAVDQTAVAVASAPSKLKVLLVTTGDVFLQDALSLRPDVQVVTEAPSAWRPAQALSPSIDLFVFDGFVPAPLPASAPYLIVGPPPDRALGSGPPVSPGPLLPAEADDPLLYDVDLADVSVALSADLSTSNFGQVVITSALGPVLMVREATASSPAAAVLGVYPHSSDLVLRDAWPVLLAHLSELLAPGTVLQPSEPPGATVNLQPGPSALAVLVTRPDGHVDRLALSAAGALFSDTSETGLYRVSVLGAGGTTGTSYFAVNPVGTPIQPQQSLDVAGAPTHSVVKAPLYHDLWPALALAALLALMVEWAVYFRAH